VTVSRDSLTTMLGAILMTTVEAPARECRNCGASMQRGGSCAECGWFAGAVPVAQSHSSDGTTTSTFVKEKRHTFYLAYALLSVFFGGAALVSGLGSGSAGGVLAGMLFGPLMIAAGVVTLKITQGGRVWWGLDPQEKAKALPGLVVGGAIGIMLIPVLIFVFAILKMVDFRDL